MHYNKQSLIATFLLPILLIMNGTGYQLEEEPQEYTDRPLQQGLNDTDTVALANALTQNRNLTALFLSNNQIGDEGAQALASMLEAGQNTTLKSISLADNNISQPISNRISAGLRRNGGT